MDIIHPIKLLARTDAEVTTVLHSFFLLAFDPVRGSVDTLSKHPTVRKNVDVVEDALKAMLYEPEMLANPKDFSVCHVLTNHDGRLFAFARCFNYKIVAVVSSLPVMSFCRLSTVYASFRLSQCHLLPMILNFPDQESAYVLGN